jgi:hypothetical protein
MSDTPVHFREEISTVAAAEKYRLTPSYVARLARTHVIRARKFGRDWIIDEQTLRAYLDQPRKPGPKPRLKETVETNGIPALNGSEEQTGEQHARSKGSGNRKTVSK